MNEATKKASQKGRKRKKRHRIFILCWVVVPLALLTMLVLDGMGIYLFNTERLLVVGACILVLLIPFISEITVKDVSVKKENTSK